MRFRMTVEYGHSRTEVVDPRSLAEIAELLDYFVWHKHADLDIFIEAA